MSLEDDILEDLTNTARFLSDQESETIEICKKIVKWHFANQKKKDAAFVCICTHFKDTRGVIIPDLACPVHGVNSTNPYSTWKYVVEE